MPPKKKIPAPIDRPLSKAYLRQFAGWSTAYPPGISEPNSLRVMENVMITRDGAARIRPGLRSFMRERSDLPLVGSHELFFTETGEKAYLIAVRNTAEEQIQFRVVTNVTSSTTGMPVPTMMTLADAGFDLPYGDVYFSDDVTYVRYLQIDNKIFALGNTAEPMVMFWVGLEKRAQRLASIDRPEWTSADKLSVVHPDKAWVDNKAPTESRTNLVPNPDFETTSAGWTVEGGVMSRESNDLHGGNYGLLLESLPQRVNLCSDPLNDMDNSQPFFWYRGDGCWQVSATDAGLQVDLDLNSSSGSAMSPAFAVPAEKRLRLAFDLVDSAHLTDWFAQAWFFDVNNETVGGKQRIGGDGFLAARRIVSEEFLVPRQATSMRVLIGGVNASLEQAGWLLIKDVFIGEGDDTSALDGDDGADYFWLGVANQSASVHHPPRDVVLVTEDLPAAGAGTYYASAYARGSGNTVEVESRGKDALKIAQWTATDSSSTTTTWARIGGTAMSPTTKVVTVSVRITVSALGYGESVEIDSVQLEKSASLKDFFHGSYPVTTTTQRQKWLGQKQYSRSTWETFASALANPPAETPAANTLISNTAGANVYNFAFFYTISNELGESAASQVTVVQTKRPWTGWEWKTPAADGSPSTTATTNPALCADQLVAVMPQAVFENAIAAGATHWNAYFYTWGPNDVPPVTAIKFAEIPLDENSIYGVDSYARLTPQQVKIGTGDPLIPTEGTLFNATDPTKGSQGLVAADRIVLVADPADPSRITWSSGQPGDFHNFSPLLGGGTKQQTFGNMSMAATVKLWQNPQSVDTLTILNLTTDGRSNALYMQPAQITSLSETINIMGFEEATGMEGTSSPYGCEVVNNGLYHPLEVGLVKSTANNYNLSHRMVTDDIVNVWQSLQRHDHIVSCVLDGRIYYLVHNIHGALLEDHCWGNEIWVCDVGAETPTWSRWLVQGVSLRTMEVGGRVMLSVVSPHGIFLLDPGRYTDESFTDDGDILVSSIPWYLETNTQGANRAHDAWANLQQLNVVMGSFQGQARYGLRGKDVNGMDIHLEKIVYATQPPWDGIEIVEEKQEPDLGDSDSGTGAALSATIEPFDREDYLLVRRIMKEWVFFAGSNGPAFSSGQVNLVQYRYTPVTVNVGYEYGSVETFEYGRSDVETATTDSGTPKPYIDTGRP